MPGPWDKDKDHGDRPRGTGRSRASSPPRGRRTSDAVASALLALVTRGGSGDASCEDGHEIKAVMGDLWGVYGDTDELVIGTHDVGSVADAEALLELLAPAVRKLRDTSPADPVCIRWGRTDGELRFDVYSLVDGEQRTLGLARARGEKTIRRLSDDADVEVSYEGPGRFDFSSESWGHYMRIRHHLV